MTLMRADVLDVTTIVTAQSFSPSHGWELQWKELGWCINGTQHS